MCISSVGVSFHKLCDTKFTCPDRSVVIQLSKRQLLLLRFDYPSYRNLYFVMNHLSANPTKWSNTRKQFVEKLPTNGLSVFDHFLGLALKELRSILSMLSG